MSAKDTSGRRDGREPDQMRPVTIETGVAPYAEGSALISVGETRVFCTASVDERVPRWMIGKGRGWVTAEYSMLPRSTQQRTTREARDGKQGGRTVEIQRLIGRSLRAVVDPDLLGERQLIIDCDVLQADGGTRCAAISGGYVALAIACHDLQRRRLVRRSPLLDIVAAISAGVVGGVPVLDLQASEDQGADVDTNIVMTGAGAFVEIQGTAEREPFSREVLDILLTLAGIGLDDLFAAQRAAIAAATATG
ncbi:MAG: ribonuclease PH [Chloroflexota bacterium]|nr:ribonuclease PH [Chloroflexota bacterium]